MKSKFVVLLVDDDDAVRLLAQRILRAEGHVVVETYNGEHAFEQVVANSLRPDIVVTDLDMPHLDGIALMQRIRDHTDPLLKNVPILVTSGDITQERQEKIAELGGHILKKPFGREDLLEAVRKLPTPKQE